MSKEMERGEIGCTYNKRGKEVGRLVRQGKLDRGRRESRVGWMEEWNEQGGST